MKKILFSIVVLLGAMNLFANEAAYEKYANGDTPGAIKDWKKTCALGDSEGCFYLGLVHATGSGVKKNTKKAKPYYQKACDGGNIVACNNLAFMYYIGDGVSKNVKKAKKLFKKACDGESITACKKYKKIMSIKTKDDKKLK